MPHEYVSNDNRNNQENGKERRGGKKRRDRQEKNESNNLTNNDLKKQVDAFTDDDLLTLSFPSFLSKSQRSFVHRYVQKYGYKSKSTGKGSDRYITIYKESKNENNSSSEYKPLTLLDESIASMTDLFDKYPLNEHEKSADILMNLKNIDEKNKLPFNLYNDQRTRQTFSVPLKLNPSNRFNEFRSNLPIYAYRDKIIETIESSQVVVISGETGSGKTTQVPQYILEHYADGDKPCRIICTQPRRIAATSIAERVSQERDDKLGNSVGYQIRLDSRIKADTNLIFTTSGFLLRCLTSTRPDEIFKSVTHLFLDEVHEREKITDFLLIVIRDGLQFNPNLKIILMSATLDSEIFSKYFLNAPIINVPGKMYPVELAYLGQIISMTGYMTANMTKYMNENKGPKILRKENTSDMSKSNENDANAVNIESDCVKQKESTTIPIEDIHFFDECLEQCMSGDIDAVFDQIYYLITEENMPVDYKHSRFGRSALSIAAEKGYFHVLTTLLNYSANPLKSCDNGITPLEYAKRNNHNDCIQLLQPFEKNEDLCENRSSDEINSTDTSNNEEHEKALEQFKLAAYLLTNSTPNDIDHNLLFHIIRYVHTSYSIDGSILVFLPGYDDIMKQNELIESHLDGNDYRLFLLHSGLDSDQKSVFQKLQNQRKIILSTNIAETSVTIDDVVYVIDSGKVKQQTYDSVSNTTCLTSTWISKACAKQRSGRSGRTRNGFCYRMYSNEHYDTMEQYTLPEILRVPLTDICLNAKILCDDVSIEDFLLKALQPPAVSSIRQSINLLKKMDALDSNENITYLGMHLAALPVDVQLGKCIMYGILFRCLDPIVTIVSALSVKDPFYLAIGDEGPKITEIKKTIANQSLSDHIMLQRTYKEWIKRRQSRAGYQYCRDNYLSYGSMQMIHGVRKLIIGHLESSQIYNNDKLNWNSKNLSIIKACLTAGLYPNVCRIDHIKGKIVTKYDRKLLPHLSSILRDRKSKNQMDPLLIEANCEYLIHGEKSKVSHYSLIKNISAVSTICIALFAGPIKLPETNVWTLEIDEWNAQAPIGYFSIDASGELAAESDDDLDNGRKQDSTFIVDDWIGFTMEKTEANLLFALRQKFCAVLSKFFRMPKLSSLDKSDLQVLNVIEEIINIETVQQMGQSDETSPMKDDKRNFKSRHGFSGNGCAFASPSYSSAVDNRRNRHKQNKQNKKKFAAGGAYANRNGRNSLHQQPTTSSNAFSSQFFENWRIEQPPRQMPNGIGALNQSNDDQNQRSKASNNRKKKSPLLKPPTIPRNRNYSSTQNSNANHYYQSGALPQSTLQPISQPMYSMPPIMFYMLMIENLIKLQNTFESHQWQFKKPLTEMRSIERQNPGATIIIFFYVKSESGVFGAGQFFSTKSNRFEIVCQQMNGFKLIKRMNVAADYRMSSQDGFDLLELCRRS